MKIKQLTCTRCGHIWEPRKSDVRECPKCKSYLWSKVKEEM